MGKIEPRRLSESDLAYEFRPRRAPRQRICGHCGWSWSVGKDGQILCLNPESPHAYDIVPVDLACSEQDPNPEQLQG
jgi:hypothetical protein